MGAEEFNPLQMLTDPEPADTGTPTVGTTQPAAGPAPAATGPAPDSGTATPAEPDATPSQDTPAAASTASAGTGVYRRRQALLALAVAVAAVAGFTLTRTGVPFAAPSPMEHATAVQETALNATMVPGTAQARTDQDAARDHYRATGSYRGFTRPGARSAAATHTWVAARATDGVCVIYAMRGTKRTSIDVDNSGIACTDAEIAATQTHLDATESYGDAAAATTAADAFAHLGRTVAAYATTSFTGGRPSLRGLPATGLVDNVTIVANDGNRLVAEHRDAGICARAAIGIDGTVGEPAPC